jgi:tetratricopeptide (TPR) repeat protein
MQTRTTVMAKGKKTGGDDVVPLFGKPLRELDIKELDEAIKAGQVTLEAPPSDDPAEQYKLENIEKFIMGDITWAQLQGITMEQAYNIAEYGYALFQESRYHDARVVFEGLVICNPYDAYFHNMLGAIYQQLDMKEEALEEYTSSIELDNEHLHAYVNRAELLLQSGQFEKAVNDLQRAVELDPNGKQPAGLRARALAKATSQAMAEVQRIAAQLQKSKGK